MPTSEVHGEHGDWALTITGREVTISRLAPEPERHLHVPLSVWHLLMGSVSTPPISHSRTAKVTTYGGGETVQHWQLEVDGRFIADSSIPADRDLFERIAGVWNGVATDVEITEAELAAEHDLRELRGRVQSAVSALRYGRIGMVTLTTSQVIAMLENLLV